MAAAARCAAWRRWRRIAGEEGVRSRLRYRGSRVGTGPCDLQGAVVRQKSAFAVNRRACCARRASVWFLPDPVARRLVVADPEVPASARGRRERPVDGADAVRASGAQRVAPDELRVMAALLAGSAGVRRVVVVLHLAGPGGDDVRRRPMAGWRAGGDVLAALTPAGVVLIVAAGGPGLRNSSRVRRPGQRRQR